MLDFGMPTLIETETLEECAALCRALGLQFVELNMNMPQYQTKRIDPAGFLRAARQYGIYYTIHLDENLNVTDFNPRVALAYRQTVFDTIALAKAIHCPVLNMHLHRGVYFTLPEGKIYLFERYKAQYLRDIADFRNECEKLIGGAQLCICVENCEGYTAFQLEALNLLLESPVFALTFDIGHNHGTDRVDETTILNRADKLFHMHMHDAVGAKNHLPLGTGEIDLPTYLALAESHHCRVVLETKTISGLRQSAEWLKSYNKRYDA